MRVVIYARLSISSDDSVSIQRQLESCQKYAEARGWEVVGQFVDDGVSASKNKPEDRPGWSALVTSSEKYGAVVIWKVDRLARRVLDFLHADEALQARGAAIVAVEDPIDMSTPQGRAFATMLAVFGEMEAAAIRARVAAARTHMIRAGRAVGGKVPYGYRNIPNPDGPGMVLAKDPEQIPQVEEMVRRTLAGQSIYSTAQDLHMHYSTVERILRNPVLAGLTPFNPGNDSKTRGSDVVRGPDGLPRVNEAVAVLPLPRWRALVRLLDSRGEAGGRAAPRAMRAKTSGVLSGLLWCAEHDEPVRMWRGTIQGRDAYRCPECHQGISSYLQDCVVEAFLAEKGDDARWTVVEEVHDGAAAMLPEIEHRLQELTEALARTDDDDEADSLMGQVAAMRALRRDARSAPDEVRLVSDPVEFFDQAWEAAEDDTERRAVLGDAIARVLVKRGRPGRGTKEKAAERLTYEWKP